MLFLFRYISKLDSESCCPLCHKDMNGSEVNSNSKNSYSFVFHIKLIHSFPHQIGDLTSELSDEIRRLPETLKQTELILKSEQRKLEQLLLIQPRTIRLETLKTDIPKNKDKLKETEERLSTAMNDAETLEISIAEPNSKADLANKLLGDMSVLDEALKDLSRIQSELATLNASVPQRTTTMTMDVAQQKKATIAAEYKKNNTDISALEDKYDQNSKLLNNLRDKRNKLKDEQIKLQEDAHALPQMKTRQLEIAEQIEKHSGELRRIESSLEPLNRRLTEIVERKKRIKDENKQIFTTAMKKLNDLKHTDADLKK